MYLHGYSMFLILIELVSTNLVFLLRRKCLVFLSNWLGRVRVNQAVVIYRLQFLEEIMLLPCSYEVVVLVEFVDVVIVEMKGNLQRSANLGLRINP